MPDERNTTMTSPTATRRRRRALRITAAIVPALALTMTATNVRADTSSVLTGTVTVHGITRAAFTGSSLLLDFEDDQPWDSVTAELPQFAATRSATIRGTTPFGTYTDTCVDSMTISGETNAPPWALGKFDRASGTLTDLPLTITVQHSLAAGPTTSLWGQLTCPNTHLPDQVAEITLSTDLPNGSPLDSAGQLAMTGIGTVTAGSGVGNPVAASVDGTVSPLPDRSVQSCVLVPDVRDDSPADATQAIHNAGLNPLSNKVTGNDPYVAQQFPPGGDCVAAGSTVRIILAPGPRP
jgi:hypothetical protein